MDPLYHGQQNNMPQNPGQPTPPGAWQTQPQKQSNLVTFLKSLIPVAVAFGIQLSVSMIIMLGVSIYAAATAVRPPDQSLIADAIQQRSLEIVNSTGFLILLQSGIMLVLAVTFIIWFFRSSASAAMTPTKKALPFRNIVLLIATGYFAQMSTSILLTIILSFFPKTAAAYNQVLSDLTGGGILATLLTTTILAPIAEELIFRGLTLRSTIRHWNSFVLVNTLQALYFGIYHMNIVQGVYAFLLGLLLGYVSYRLNNIYASILLHAAVNGSAFLMFFPPSFMDHIGIMILVSLSGYAVLWALIYLLRIPSENKITIDNHVNITKEV